MDEDTFAIFIPIVAIVMSLSIPIVYMLVDYRRRRDLVDAHHRERMAAIERGMEIPPLPESLYKPNRRPRHLLTGMIWFFLGAGIFVSLGALAGREVGFLGFVPGGVGIAYLLYYLIEGRHERTEAGESSPPAPRA
jgi:hypothetical protein